MDVSAEVEPQVVEAPQTRRLYNTKPKAWRLKEPPAPPMPGLPAQMVLRMEVGGKKVAFSNQDGFVVIAGTKFNALGWFDFMHRVNLLFERAGRLDRVKPATNPDIEGSSSFLTKNVRTILRLNKGYIQEIPVSNGPHDEEHIAWMKERFSMVVTREEYSN
jgi:hypothetical protein